MGGPQDYQINSFSPPAAILVIPHHTLDANLTLLLYFTLNPVLCCAEKTLLSQQWLGDGPDAWDVSTARQENNGRANMHTHNIKYIRTHHENTQFHTATLTTFTKGYI